MLVAGDLADAINVAIGATDVNGDPITTTPEMLSYADAIINTLQAGSLDNATGTVNATGVPLAPIADGNASNGLLTLSSTPWLAELTSGFPTADSGKLSDEAAASVGYLESNSDVSFSTGNITGVCTATPINPGILAGGAGSNGTLGGLSGTDWASAVLSALGISPTTLGDDIYNAIVAYLEANAEGQYTSGAVTGAFAPGGGPMTAGTGTAGTVI